MWGDEIGDPHSHGWSGAYQVLSGTAIHARYTFRERARIDPKFAIGHLTLASLGIQTPGATELVPAGSSCIHGQSYADRPGLSLSVRAAETAGLTLTYWEPGVALEASHVDDLTRRAIQGLDALYLADPGRCARALRRAVQTNDFRRAFVVLRHAQRAYGQQIDVGQIIEHAAPYLGTHGPSIVGALAHFKRLRSNAKNLETLRTWNHRFLAGVLHFSPNRRVAERLIASRLPRADAGSFLESQLLELAATEAQPGHSLLGLPLHPDVAAVLALALRHRTYTAVLRHLAKEYDPADIKRKERTVRRIYQGLRSHPLLAPAFA